MGCINSSLITGQYYLLARRFQLRALPTGPPRPVIMGRGEADPSSEGLRAKFNSATQRVKVRVERNSGQFDLFLF